MLRGIKKKDRACALPCGAKRTLEEYMATKVEQRAAKIRRKHERSLSRSASSDVSGSPATSSPAAGSWIYFINLFFSAHADGERRGLGRVGG